MVAGVVVGDGEAAGGLLGGKGAVGTEHEAHVRADRLRVVRVERQVDGEPLGDEPVAKGRGGGRKGSDRASSCYLHAAAPVRGRVVLH